MFCHGLGRLQKKPRAILSVPVEKGMVNQKEIEKILPDGMELFVKEVVDFFQQNMQNINLTDFFEKLIYVSDVQIPLLIAVINPEMKEGIVVKNVRSIARCCKQENKEVGLTMGLKRFL